MCASHGRHQGGGTHASSRAAGKVAEVTGGMGGNCQRRAPDAATAHGHLGSTSHWSSVVPPPGSGRVSALEVPTQRGGRGEQWGHCRSRRPTRPPPHGHTLGAGVGSEARLMARTRVAGRVSATRGYGVRSCLALAYQHWGRLVLIGSPIGASRGKYLETSATGSPCSPSREPKTWGGALQGGDRLAPRPNPRVSAPRDKPQECAERGGGVPLLRTYFGATRGGAVGSVSSPRSRIGNTPRS
jgi:hypothetical protein